MRPTYNSSIWQHNILSRSHLPWIWFQLCFGVAQQQQRRPWWDNQPVVEPHMGLVRRNKMKLMAEQNSYLEIGEDDGLEKKKKDSKLCI
jgi:hypothetical protein